MTAAGRQGNTSSTDELYEFFVKGAFEYRDTGFDLDTFPKQSFVFEVRAARNLFLALCQSKDSYVADQMYEFLIGGWTCTKSVMRKNKFENGPELSTAMTYGILNEFSFRPFWVSWNDGRLRLGQGTVIGQKVVLSYTDAKPFRPKFLSFAGWDVPVTVIVHRETPSPTDFMQITVPNYFVYNDTGLRMDLSTRNYILFEAKAARNVFIALTQYKDTYVQDKMYEVLIGGWTNTKSTLRRNKFEGAPKLAEANTPGILSETEFRPFWFSWANGRIYFGTGKVVGQNILLDYTDPNPIPIYHLAIAGWDVFGTVILHREPLLVGDSVKDGIPSAFTYHDAGLRVSKSTSKSMVFQGMAARDMFIAMSLHKEWVEYQKTYEVLMGGNGNTICALRKTKYAGAPLLAQATTADIMSEKELRTYWISWKNPIQFGKGSVVGQNVILEYTDTSLLPINWLSLAGWDVTGNVLYQRELTPPDTIQVNIPNAYQYWDVPGLTLAPRQSIVVEICAQQHVFVALSTHRFTYDANRMYSFLIGGLSNTQSILRKDLHGVGPELVNVKTPGILTEFTFTTFWLSWADGTVKLGKGSDVGQNSVLEYQDPNPIPVNYLAFAGWDVPGTAIVHRGVFDVNMADNYTYTDTGLTLSPVKSLVFNLKASNNACLALTSTKGNYGGKIYEIVFGAYGNNCTIIRIAKHDNMVASASSPGILDPDNFRPFWISWSNNNILAGKGAVVGEHILAAYDEYGTPVAVNYLGVTGYDEPGVFRFE